MSNSDKQIMIYGANGYTGKLIAEYAIAQGLKPILAGRNKPAISNLGEKLSLETRIFSLDSVEEIIHQLSDVFLTIHCAGPFSATAKPMMMACIASNTHYTDITGEIVVFELAQQLNQQASDAGIVICPGIGFDVIPTDCLASQLKDKLPDAIHLALGFDSDSSMSPGTAKTAVEGLANGGSIRKNGKLVNIPLAYKSRTIDFGCGMKNAITIPWGDVSTAFHSTGIPNIEVFIPLSPKRAKGLRRMNWFKWLLKLKFVQDKIKAKIDKSVKGPTKKQRESLRTYFWGQATNAAGKIITARLQTANGYQLTYLGAIAVAKFLLAEKVAGGTYTPSKLINNQLVHTLEGCSQTVFTED